MLLSYHALASRNHRCDRVDEDPDTLSDAVIHKPHQSMAIDSSKLEVLEIEMCGV